MGAKLSKYDHDLSSRIEIIRKREKLKQTDMAALMGVPLERYKRFIYGEAKNPTEAIATLFESLPVDQDYVLFGRERGVIRLIDYFLGCSDGEKATFYMELARMYRKRENESKVDYTTEVGIMETRKKNKTK